MVITRSDVCHKRAQYIVRGFIAEFFFKPDIVCNHIKRHVSWTFNDYLDIPFPCPPGQVAKYEHLVNLAPVTGVMYCAGPQSVSKAYYNIVLGQNIENFIVVFVKWILAVVDFHPFTKH